MNPKFYCQSVEIKSVKESQGNSKNSVEKMSYIFRKIDKIFFVNKQLDKISKYAKSMFSVRNRWLHSHR